MAEEQPKKKKPAVGSRSILIALAIFGLALVIGGLFLPKIINWLHPLGNRDWPEMGQRGDLYGGFMNPILSFLAFMGVLYSIYLQRLDLRETQQESQRQQFESTFFQLLAQQSRLSTSETATMAKRLGGVTASTPSSTTSRIDTSESEDRCKMT